MSNPNTQEINDLNLADTEQLIEQNAEQNIKQDNPSSVSRAINYIQNNPRRFIAYSAAASATLAVPALSLAVGVYPTPTDFLYLPLTGMTLGAIGGGLTTGAVAGASAVNRAISNKEESLAQLGKKRPREDNNNEPESKKQKTETVEVNNEEDIVENNDNAVENNDNIVENNDNVVENNDSVVENNDNVVENNDSVVENNDSVEENNDSVVENGDNNANSVETNNIVEAALEQSKTMTTTMKKNKGTNSNNGTPRRSSRLAQKRK